MITSAIEYKQQGFITNASHSSPMTTYNFMSMYINTSSNPNTLTIQAVRSLKEDSQRYFSLESIDFATINISEFQLGQYYKVSLRYEPVPPATTTPLMNKVYLSFVFKLIYLDNAYQVVATPDNCPFDSNFNRYGATILYHVDPNNIWNVTSFSYHNAIVKLEPISEDDSYYSSKTFKQTDNYSVRSGSYSNILLACMNINQNYSVYFGNCGFSITRDEATAEFNTSLNFGSIPLSKFMPNVYYSVTTYNNIGGGSTVWRFKVVNNRVTELTRDGIAQTISGNYAYLEKYGNATSGGGDNGGINRWTLQIVREWNPPNLASNINGAIRSYDNGWINADGVARQIDKMWVNIDGVLKQV